MAEIAPACFREGLARPAFFAVMVIFCSLLSDVVPLQGSAGSGERRVGHRFLVQDVNDELDGRRLKASCPPAPSVLAVLSVVLQ